MDVRVAERFDVSVKLKNDEKGEKERKTLIRS